MKDGASSYLRFLAGDNSGLTEIVIEYRNSLILFINGYVHNLDNAEDLAEDVLAYLYVKRPRYRGESYFKTWLFTIARNLSLDYLKKYKRREIMYIDSLSYDEHKEAKENQYINHTSAEDAFFRDESKHILYRAMGKLPEQYRDVLHLMYLERFSHSEISKIMKKSEKQIYNLVYRAKNELRAILQEEGYNYEDLCRDD